MTVKDSQEDSVHSPSSVLPSSYHQDINWLSVVNHFAAAHCSNRESSPEINPVIKVYMRVRSFQSMVSKMSDILLGTYRWLMIADQCWNTVDPLVVTLLSILTE